MSDDLRAELVEAVRAGPLLGYPRNLPAMCVDTILSRLEQVGAVGDFYEGDDGLLWTHDGSPVCRFKKP